jgi:hypothetical protein
MKNKTNLLNPTPAQIKHRNRLWVDALMKNKRKARGEMYNHNRGRCCLAVAQDVAYSCGLDIERKAGDGNFPHDSVGEFFGWDTNIPLLTVVMNGKPRAMAASTLNDGLGNETDPDVLVHNAKLIHKGLSHKQIAECVLNTYVHPTKIKQSFKI